MQAEPDQTGPSASLQQALDHANQLLATRPDMAVRQAEAILDAVPAHPQALLILGAGHRRTGNIAAAAAILRPLARSQPTAAGVHHEWGLTQTEQGDPAGAIASLRHAVRLKPGLAQAWRALGDAHTLAGDTQAADAAYAQHIRAGAHDPALMQAAAALCDNDLPLAEHRLRAHLRAHPTDVAALRMLAETGTRLGRYADAERVLASCLRLAPGFSLARYNYALVLHRQGSSQDAVPHLRQLLAADPRDPTALNLLAACLAVTGDTDEAIAAYRQVLQVAPNQPKIWLSYGHVLKTAGRRAETVQAYRTCLRLAPGLGEAWWSLANLKNEPFSDTDLAEMRSQLRAVDPRSVVEHVADSSDHAEPVARPQGEVERVADARGAVERVVGPRGAAEPVSVSPGLVERVADPRGQFGPVSDTWEEGGPVSNPRKGIEPVFDARGEGERVAVAQDKVERVADPQGAVEPVADPAGAGAQGEGGVGMRPAAGPPDEDGFHLHYALGAALERRGEFTASYAHYAAGARLRRAQVDYSAERTHAQLLRARALFTRAFFAARAGWGCPNPSPIFVVGLPRSGSTLIEQILASHSRVEGTMELPELTNIARDLRPAAGEDTYPDVLATLDRPACAALGQRYLDRTRGYRKLGRAFFVDKMPNNFVHVGLIQLILPRATIIDARRAPMAACFAAFKQHFARGQHFSYDLGELGRYYADYAALMAHVDEVLPGRVHQVSYEAMVEDTEAETRRLLAHCGLAFEPACLRFHENPRAVRTASSEQVRRPIYRDGLEQWRMFEPWLGPLKALLS